jgi:hypothetical protein
MKDSLLFPLDGVFLYTFPYPPLIISGEITQSDSREHHQKKLKFNDDFIFIKSCFHFEATSTQFPPYPNLISMKLRFEWNAKIENGGNEGESCVFSKSDEFPDLFLKFA